MTRFWIGVAAALWLGSFALGDDETTPPPPQRRPATGLTTSSAASPAPATSAERSAAAQPSLPAPVVLPEAKPITIVLDKDGGHHHARTVIRLNVVPAAGVAGTISSLLRAEGQAERSKAAAPSVVIVPDPVSNSLLVGGSPETVEAVRQVTAQLDRPAAMIRLEVVIGEVPTSKLDAGPEEVRKQMDVLVQGQATTLDNQAVHIHFGRGESFVTNTINTAMGRQYQVQYKDVGTILKATPRLGADGMVTLQLDIKEERIGPLTEGLATSAPAQSEPLRTPNIEKGLLNGTLHLRDGQPVVAAGMSRAPKSDKQMVALITVHVLAIGSEPKAVSSAPAAVSAERNLPAQPSPPLPVAPPETKPIPIVPDKAGGQHHTRTVIRLNAVPAAELANTIISLLSAESQAEQSDPAAPSVVIVPNPVGNSLVVGGPPEAVEVVRQLAAQLDRPAAMIRLEVVIGEVPTAKLDAGPEEVRQQMDVLLQAQVTTLDNQAVYLSNGRAEPFASAIIEIPGKDRGWQSQTQYKDVGTILKATPRMGADGTVTVKLSFEDSRIVPSDKGVAIFTPAKGKPHLAVNYDKGMLDTTLHLRDSQTVVAAGMSSPRNVDKQMVALVTAHVLAIGGEAKAVK